MGQAPNPSLAGREVEIERDRRKVNAVKVRLTLYFGLGLGRKLPYPCGAFKSFVCDRYKNAPKALRML